MGFAAGFAAGSQMAHRKEQRRRQQIIDYLSYLKDESYPDVLRKASFNGLKTIFQEDAKQYGWGEVNWDEFNYEDFKSKDLATVSKGLIKVAKEWDDPNNTLTGAPEWAASLSEGLSTLSGSPRKQANLLSIATRLEAGSEQQWARREAEKQNTISMITNEKLEQGSPGEPGAVEVGGRYFVPKSTEQMTQEAATRAGAISKATAEGAYPVQQRLMREQHGFNVALADAKARLDSQTPEQRMKNKKDRQTISSAISTVVANNLGASSLAGLDPENRPRAEKIKAITEKLVFNTDMDINEAALLASRKVETDLALGNIKEKKDLKKGFIGKGETLDKIIRNTGELRFVDPGRLRIGLEDKGYSKAEIDPIIEKLFGSEVPSRTAAPQEAPVSPQETRGAVKLDTLGDESLTELLANDLRNIDPGDYEIKGDDGSTVKIRWDGKKVTRL